MKVVYIADDGKEFDTEKECKEYENNHQISIKKLIRDGVLIGYDEDGIILECDLTDPDYTDDDWLEDAFYARTTRGLTTQEINDIFMTYGVRLPFYTKGLYRYDWDSGSWISYKKEYENLKNRWKHLDEGGI